MIVLLNLLTIGIAILGVALAYKLHRVWPLAVSLVVLTLYMQFQPSYMPKGQVTRSDVPVFEQTESVIEDRNSKPKSGGDYDKEMEEKVKKGLPFRQE